MKAKNMTQWFNWNLNHFVFSCEISYYWPNKLIFQTFYVVVLLFRYRKAYLIPESTIGLNSTYKYNLYIYRKINNYPAFDWIKCQIWCKLLNIIGKWNLFFEHFLFKPYTLLFIQKKMTFHPTFFISFKQTIIMCRKMIPYQSNALPSELLSKIKIN